MSATFLQYLPTPIGFLKISGTEKFVNSIEFSDSYFETHHKLPDAILLCVNQLNEYFEGKRTKFDFPIQMRGTDFQKKVWNELLNIPFGETISYKQQATRMGNLLSIRAVGTANGRNPIVIVIPCHRVIGTNGKLVGYGGGLWRKQWLLSLELRVKS